MTVVVVVGVIADKLGAVTQLETVKADHYTRNFDVRRVYMSSPSTEYRHTQASEIRVDVDHDRPVGSVRYLERDQRGRLHAVCEVDPEGLQAGPWYFSPEVRHRNGKDIELRALAVTKKPASVALGPIEAWPGTLEELAPTIVSQHGRTGELLRRAHEFNRRRRYGDPLVVHEYPPTPAERSNGGKGLATEGAYGLEHRRPAGRLRYGPPGKVLRVS